MVLIVNEISNYALNPLKWVLISSIPETHPSLIRTSTKYIPFFSYNQSFSHSTAGFRSFSRLLTYGIHVDHNFWIQHLLSFRPGSLPRLESSVCLTIYSWLRKRWIHASQRTFSVEWNVNILIWNLHFACHPIFLDG